MSRTPQNPALFEVASIEPHPEPIAISPTAIPRRPGTKVGKLSGIRLRTLTARAENSVRICGTPEARFTTSPGKCSGHAGRAMQEVSGTTAPEYFCEALEATSLAGLNVSGFTAVG
jgi:hypothetical protein